MSKKNKILIVVGARPNFIKIAPLFWEFKKYPEIQPILVHTGQHYDAAMSQIFFQELDIPQANYNLKIGSESHARQTAKIMLALEPIILKEKPDLVMVAGDVNSALAGALTAVKLNLPIAHIEAGLRSFDNSMPEEINRKLIDQISNLLFVTEPSGVKNLLHEGISKEKIYLVGNIMIDSLNKSKIKSQKSKISKRLNLIKKKYALLTLHRPSNVDNQQVLTGILQALNEIQKRIPIVMALHPRTKKKISEFKLEKLIKKFILTPPLAYLDFLNLMQHAKLILTDSGGIQEEATILKIPCLTLRENTERPITVKIGTNTLVGIKKNNIIQETDKILKGQIKKVKAPKLWDGRTAQRIMKILHYFLI